jgi:hypothetical protein
VSGSVSGNGRRVAVRVGDRRERERGRDAVREPSLRVPLTLSRTQATNREPPTNTLTLTLPLSLTLTLAATRAPASFGCIRQAAMCPLW